MAKPTPQQERVALRRSLYAPANARKNKLPTQAFLRAAEFGDLPAVRSMALDCSAELSGLRCKNFLECDPHHLVDSAHYLNNTERKNLKYQFTELPELLNAIGSVQVLPPKLGHSASSPLDDPPGPTRDACVGKDQRHHRSLSSFREQLDAPSLHPGGTFARLRSGQESTAADLGKGPKRGAGAASIGESLAERAYRSEGYADEP